VSGVVSPVCAACCVFLGEGFLAFRDPSVPSLLLNGGAVSARYPRFWSPVRCALQAAFRLVEIEDACIVRRSALSVYDELVISGSAGCISEALPILGALPFAGGPLSHHHHSP
jgi:hypothetical protein